jgi:hypothetical protein
VDFVTVGPTPVSTPPTFSTLNGYVCAFSSSPCVISNAAIVPAGTSGSVDVYASQNTHLIIDINGYYAAQSGITLAQGTAAAPSLSFTGDAGTGLYSSATGKLDVAAGGTTVLSANSAGDVGIGTGNPSGLQVNTGVSETLRGSDNVRFGVSLGTPRAIFEDDASATQWEMDNLAGRFRIFTPGMERFTIDSNGQVGIGGQPNYYLSRLEVIGMHNIGNPPFCREGGGRCCNFRCVR